MSPQLSNQKTPFLPLFEAERPFLRRHCDGARQRQFKRRSFAQRLHKAKADAE